MNAMTGQLHQDFVAVWVTNTGAVASAKSQKELGSEEIGIFPADDYCEGVYTATTDPSFKKNKRFFISQGVAPFEGQAYFGSTRSIDLPRKSLQFEADDIVKWEGQKAKRGAQTQAIAIGYDGLNANKSLTANLDVKPIIVRIILSGEPIRKFFNAKDAKIMREYTIDKNLCVGKCNCVDTCGKVPCETIADGLIAAIEQDKFNNQSISTFIRASKLQKCENAAAPVTKKEYKKYTVTVCDDGSSTLGYLAAANTSKVVLEKREGVDSTYAIWKAATDGAPTNATITGSVIPDCGNCPTGYTSVPEAHVYDIKVPKGTSVPSLPGQISVTKLGTDGTTDGYVALLSKTWDDDSDVNTAEVAVELTAVDAILEPVASTYTYMGLRTQICISDTSTTLTWVDSGEKKYSTTKKYSITLGDTECGTSRLADLQKGYPDLTIAEEAESGACLHAFNTTVESNLVSPEECDRIETYSFTAPEPFEGIEWYDYSAVQTAPDCSVPGAVTPECCSCGVVLEPVVFKQFYKDCTFGWYNWHPNDALPVSIQVTTHTADYTSTPCEENKDYVTELRQASFNRGTSGEVVQEYERKHAAYENKFWEPNPYVNEINGFEVKAKPYFMYDTYKLTLRRPGHDSTYIQENQNLMKYIFYVRENEGKSLETLINKLVESTGRKDLKAVVL